MKLIPIILLLLASHFSDAQEIEKHYKIYDVNKQKTITLSELIVNTKYADVVFFGEEHNDSIGHNLAFLIFKEMTTQHKTVALSLEMFHNDVQTVIDEYLNGSISEKNFIRDARAWNNYKDYKPLIEFAKQNKLTVLGANTATRYSNMVTRTGLESLKTLPKSSFRFLPPLPVDTLAGRYYEKFTALLGAHNMGGMKVYQSQNLWDATMAWSIAKFAKANKNLQILHLNGRFHSDEKLGAFAQLKKYAPKLRTINISSFSSDDFEQPNWAKHQKLGDYIILTDPKVKRSY